MYLYNIIQPMTKYLERNMLNSLFPYSWCDIQNATSDRKFMPGIDIMPEF